MPDALDIPPVPAVDGVTPEQFAREIIPAARPVVFKGLVSQWPAVRQGLTSPQTAAGYLKAMDLGMPTTVLEAGSQIEGRFAYGPDMYDFNFNRSTRSISAGVDQLLGLLEHPKPPYVYVQSTPLDQYMPKFAAENPCPLLPPQIGPRIWISNATRAQTHNDNDYNIACVVAGRRRFTLFPPEQVTNLYIGPFERTPSGRPISLASLEAPDFDAHPKFRDAIATAQVAELEPGDALYIPRYWWHHVQSLERFNILINYWWGTPANPLENPVLCFNDAILALKDLPPVERDYWKVMFDHYIFQANGNPVAHIPERHQGGLGRHTREIRIGLIRSLQQAFLGRN
ncbi:cupin-like domain-containing protein [Asticcacaulis solisilvae]|uniref:cupin-like domain-containing protein n=1 Tax=Asticcacaulis solisilvae TaxID=1217274 RepID=UPI003FD7D067